MDLFRVLINERPSELYLIDHNSEEVHNLQSANEKKILMLLSASVKRFCVSCMRAPCFARSEQHSLFLSIEIDIHGLMRIWLK